MATLTISVPIYNAENYLDRCIGSVMSQRDQSFDLVLVDDGSTDNSPQICQSWQKKYPSRIKYVYKDNSGSLLTRRRCMAESEGEYLLIIDADDYLATPNAVGTIKEAIEDLHCDLLIFGYYRDYGMGPVREVMELPVGRVFDQAGRDCFYRQLLSTSKLNTLWNKAFHRSLVDWESPYDAYPHVTNGTDAFQLIPIATNAKRMAYIDSPLYYYFEAGAGNAGSITQSFSPTVYEALRERYFRLEEYSKEWGLPEEERVRLLGAGYMRMATTSLYRARLFPKGMGLERRNYIKRICNDELFGQCYTQEGLSIPRRLLSVAARYKCYRIIELMVKANKFWYNAIKRRAAYGLSD